MKSSVLFILVGLILVGCTSTAAAQPIAVNPATPTILPITNINNTLFSSPTPTESPSLAPTSIATATPLPPSATPTPTHVGITYGVRSFPEGINPLTGSPVLDPQLLERRPIVIKVTNFPRSVRPQWGLSQADHIYEYYIGDNMSRFIGVFYGRDASRVGPVRSARLFDQHVMRMYNAFFVFGWADDPVLEFFTTPELKHRLVVERGDNCPPLCRIGSDHAYNNLFADTAQIGPYLAEKRTPNERQDLTGLRFEVNVPKSGHPAQHLYTRYSSISYHHWEFDETTQRYLRFQETNDDVTQEPSYAALTDSLTGTQLAADNIVILLVPHQYYYKSSDTEIIDQPIFGEGNGFALRNGQIYPITWQHDSPYEQISLILPNGKYYPLKPGNVWFEILSENSSLTQLGDSSWNFDFSMPPDS